VYCGYEPIITTICTLHQQIIKKLPSKKHKFAPALRRGFLLSFDDICNIGELHVFSIYRYLGDIWVSGKISQPSSYQTSDHTHPPDNYLRTYAAAA
jgi:hypothetical protein